MDPDFAQVQPDDKLQLAMQVCDEMMGKDDRIISTNSSYSDGDDYRYIVASNGFEGETASSYFSLSANVSIHGEGDARPESFWYDVALRYNDLTNQAIGTKA